MTNVFDPDVYRIRHGKDMSMFYEIRRETAVAGKGKELAQVMYEHVIPLHQHSGMTVVAAFTDLDDDDAFVWIRKFNSTEEREATVERVHADPRWDSTVAGAVVPLLAADAVTIRLLPTAGSALQ
jgi:hypothetical protein